MRYCHQCGTAMGDADKFCPSCGAKAEVNSSNANAQAYGNASANTNSQTYGNASANTDGAGAYNTQEGNVGQAWQAWQASGQKAADAGAYRTGYQYDPVGTVDTLVMKMRSLSTAWMVIGIIQIIIGTVGLCVIAGLAPLVMGIYNVVQSSKLRKQAESFQQWPVGIVRFFEARETSVIVILILNIFFGLIFGIVGSILEFTTKSYAMDHREDLRLAEDMANRSAQMN